MIFRQNREDTELRWKISVSVVLINNCFFFVFYINLLSILVGTKTFWYLRTQITKISFLCGWNCDKFSDFHFQFHVHSISLSLLIFIFLLVWLPRFFNAKKFKFSLGTSVLVNCTKTILWTPINFLLIQSKLH